MESPAAARTLAGIRLAAPAAAERARKSRRVGDDDGVDMIILLGARETEISF
jgi:hypothetical protein